MMCAFLTCTFCNFLNGQFVFCAFLALASCMQSVYVIFSCAFIAARFIGKKNQLSMCFSKGRDDVFAPVETSVERRRHCRARVFLDLAVP